MEKLSISSSLPSGASLPTADRRPLPATRPYLMTMTHPAHDVEPLYRAVADRRRRPGFELTDRPILRSHLY